MSTLQKILVTTDFSDNASAVYGFAVKIAKDFGATIDLIYVTPKTHYLPVGNHAAGFPINQLEDEGFREKIENKLDTELNAEIPEKFRGKRIIKYGNPADAIKTCAEEDAYDLIMIASRGEGDSIFNKGSVSEKLMRISHIPVMSVQKGQKMDFKAITVPTDGSDVSFEALPLAHHLAVKRNANIDLLSISKTDFINAKMGENTPYILKDAAVKEYILKGLKEFANAKSSGFQFEGEPGLEDETFQLKDEQGNAVDVSIVVKKGDSAHLGVAEYAEKNAQMVVMATHGHSKLTSMFVGSTTDKVFKNLKMPIMTIKPDFAQKT